MTEKVTDAAAFAAVQLRLPGLVRELDEQLTNRDTLRDELVVERGKLNNALREEEAELESLTQRSGNLPEHLVRLRRQICEDLRVPEKDLLFAAELVAVKPEEREWEASIEMVLRGFALSLLVP